MQAVGGVSGVIPRFRGGDVVADGALRVGVAESAVASVCIGIRIEQDTRCVKWKIGERVVTTADP